MLVCHYFHTSIVKPTEKDVQYRTGVFYPPMQDAESQSCTDCH